MGLMENSLVYELRGVSYSYSGRFGALKDIDLDVKRGEEIALVGANGSGKSTLLLVLAGLYFPDSGSVKFSGKDLKEDSFDDRSFQEGFRSRVGIVFQNSDMQLFNSSVDDELLFGLTQLGLPRAEIDRRIKEYVALMDIGHLMQRHPQALSIGEKKRVAIASVLVMEPEILLLDEPTSGLDPRTSRHLVEAISKFSDKGCTIIASTQDIHIVPEIAQRLVVMGEDKRKVRDGNAEEILKDLDFLDAHNLIHSHVHKHKSVAHVHPHGHPSHDHTH